MSRRPPGGLRKRTHTGTRGASRRPVGRKVSSPMLIEHEIHRRKGK